MTAFSEHLEILENAPDVDWRDEKRRLWKATYPTFGVGAILFFCSIVIDSDVASSLLGFGLVVLFVASYLAFEDSIKVTRYGKKYAAKLVAKKISNMGVTGTVEVYLSDKRSVTATFKHPPPHRDRKYSSKNYAWPEVGEIVVVYYWDGKPGHAHLIWEQFNKNR